jgi:hypothetical protein
MRNLERRRHQEDLLYHVVAYLVSLDKLFDDQARHLREQISRAEQAEVTVRMHQVRVAQAEARTATAISSEAVAQENGNPEGGNDDELFIPLEEHSTPEDDSPRE